MRKLKLIIFLLIFVFEANYTYSQSEFDMALFSDSTYRFNSSLSVLDSLILFRTEKSMRDTAFYNSYGNEKSFNLEQLLRSAVNNNPELKAMEFKVDVAKYFAEEKSFLPDPMFEFELDDIMSDFGSVNMINFYISQMFPFPGKLSLQKKSILSSSRMIQSEVVMKAVEIMNEVKANFYDLYFITKKLQINKENKLIIKTFIAATESQYTVGKAMQQEVFKAHLEMARLQNEEFLLNQEKKNIFAELTKLTKANINENTKIDFVDVNIDYLLKKDNFNIDDNLINKLIDYAFARRPDLKMIENKISMNKTDLDMAKIDRLPDFNVKLGYKILPYEEMNAFSFMIGINIPLAPWSSGKYDFAIQKNEINIKSSIEEYNTKRNEIKSEIVTIINNMRSLKETMNFYYSVQIPQTENTLKSTQYSYETNMTDFLDLLDSYKMYQEAKLMYYESVNMYLKMTAELEKAVGINLKN